MLISEIRDEIISETGGDTSDTDLQTTLLGFIKAALRKLPLWTRSRTLITTSSLSLLTSASSVALPSDFIEERDVYRKSAAGKRTQIFRYPHGTFNNINTALIGDPSFYIIIGKTIYFDKTVATGITIYLEHSKDVSGVVAGDTFALNPQDVEVVKDLVKHIYYSDYEEDIEKSDRKLVLANIGMEKMDAEYMSKALPGHVEEA